MIQRLPFLLATKARSSRCSSVSSLLGSNGSFAPGLPRTSPFVTPSTLLSFSSMGERECRVSRKRRAQGPKNQKVTKIGRTWLYRFRDSPSLSSLARFDLGVRTEVLKKAQAEVPPGDRVNIAGKWVTWTVRRKKA
jgi:hypothetical protein